MIGAPVLWPLRTVGSGECGLDECVNKIHFSNVLPMITVKPLPKQQQQVAATSINNKRDNNSIYRGNIKKKYISSSIKGKEYYILVIVPRILYYLAIYEIK